MFKQDAPLAQLEAQLTLNQLVPGSSPGRCTLLKPLQANTCKGFVVLGR